MISGIIPASKTLILARRSAFADNAAHIPINGIIPRKNREIKLGLAFQWIIERIYAIGQIHATKQLAITSQCSYKIHKNIYIM